MDEEEEKQQKQQQQQQAVIMISAHVEGPVAGNCEGPQLLSPTSANNHEGSAPEEVLSREPI